MRLAAMQPYFFPYLGYFSLLENADQFVVFDPVQYIRHGWINRNRILKPSGQQAQYIHVPVAKHARATPIRDIRIATGKHWKKRIFGQIRHYQKQAPYYKDVFPLIEDALQLETDRIVDLNVHCLSTLCRVLEIECEFILFEQIEPDMPPVNQPGEWALSMASVTGADCYVNPVGGVEIFDAHLFKQSRIGLEFLQNNLDEYSQRNESFIPGLSILDVLMFNGFEETNKLIQSYRIVEG